MKNLIIVTLALVLLTACGKDMPQASSGNKLIEVAGVIRVDRTTKEWYLINDEDHAPLNLISAESQPGSVILHYTFKAVKIHSLVVTPDECYAINGINAGASVNMDNAIIFFGKYIDGLPTRINTEDMVIENCSPNLWIYGVFEVAQ